MATASPSGMEWLTATNSQSNGPSRAALALAHLDGDRGDAVLVELGLEEGEREAGPDDGDVRALAQQVRHPADVVLVAVGEHDGVDASRRSRIQVKSGRITSTPGWCSSGKSTPQSTTSSRPACSKTVMLRPISPSPPSGTTRRPLRARAGSVTAAAAAGRAAAHRAAAVGGASRRTARRRRPRPRPGAPRGRCSSARSSCAPETNHDSKALGGR